MCGIAGSINCEYHQEFLDTLSHRGPDDSGRLEYKNTQIGHTRLSILDTSKAGHQPMKTSDGKLTIIFNGEIYNHPVLRAELNKEGYSFNSGSDTETLLKGWHCWGKKVLEKLNGIFAFAVLDKQRDKITVVRDQFGIKPLYVFEKEDIIAFASELKIFEHLHEFDDSLNPRAFTQYLSFLWAPGEQTPYRHVRKILPGHYVDIPLSSPAEVVTKSNITNCLTKAIMLPTKVKQSW
ncbi:MAG: carbapenam-3-carboxylate synthase domain-containing protein [Balneolaceae bacterium]|nr:carbapenam-3-carboxylate synthase domain-containing protein [Balneolaceae bacterium]